MAANAVQIAAIPTANSATMPAPSPLAALSARWSSLSWPLIVVLGLSILLVTANAFWVTCYFANPGFFLARLSAWGVSPIDAFLQPSMAAITVFTLLTLLGFLRTKPRFYIADLLAFSGGLFCMLMLIKGLERHAIGTVTVSILYSFTGLWLLNLLPRIPGSMRFLLLACAAPTTLMIPLELMAAPIIAMALSGWQSSNTAQKFGARRYFKAR